MTVILLLATEGISWIVIVCHERLTIARYLDIVAKLSRLTVDLGAVVEELFKVSAVEDTVCGGPRVVDDEFVFRRRGLCGGGLKHQGVSLLRR